MSETRYPPSPAGLLNKMRRFRRLRTDTLGYLMSLPGEFPGGITHIQLGMFHSFFVYDPDLIHEILVKQASKFHKTRTVKRSLGPILGQGLLTSDGEFWRRQRKLAQPAFHHQRIQGYAEAMVSLAQETLAEWQDGQVRDAAEDMMTLTLSIVAKTLFDAEVSGEAGKVAAAMEVLQRIASDRARQAIPLPNWLPTPSVLRMRRAAAELDVIIQQIIDQRRASGEDKGDLLSMLLLAQDDDTGERMTDHQLRDEVMTLFLAGHETTALTLTWAWYLLANNPQVEARLHAELDSVLAGRAPTLADLPQLPYTLQVVKETLRLYPAAWIISRQPIEDVTIGGYFIPKDSLVAISPYVNHHSSAFAQPEAFMPERFAEGREQGIPRYAYFPFGGGPRVCIGNQFALMEAHLLLAALAQHFSLRLVSAEPAALDPQITLRPVGGMPMRLEARTPQPVPHQAEATIPA